MKRLVSFLRVCLVSTLMVLASDAGGEELESFAAADALGLIPSPRSIWIDTGAPVSLEGFEIRLGEDTTLLRSAAEELNRKLRLEGAGELPVALGLAGAKQAVFLAAVEHEGAAEYGEALAVTRQDPGSQGYALDLIEEGGRRILAVIGSDEEGAFYGAMTLWHMLAVEDGGANWVRGRVRDWPAFRRRVLGHLGDWEWTAGLSAAMSEAELAARKAQVLSDAETKARWLALHKVNYAYLIGDRLSAPGDPVLDIQDRLLGAASRMALERFNVRTRRTWGTHLNDELSDGEWLDCVMRGKEKHCWTAEAAHAKHAENLIARSRTLGLTNFVLHAVDGGRLYDPEWWSRRCERCRATYGEDHTRAASEQFNFYYAKMREAMPEAEFEAVIWPYHFQWAVEGFADNYNEMTTTLPHQGIIQGLEGPEHAAAVVADLKNYHATLNEQLPPDTLITFREGGPREFAAATAIHDKHPLNIWIYWGRTEGMQPLFFPQARFAKTWLRTGHDDQIHTEKARRMDYTYPVVSNEYAWNPDQPDAEATFETAKRLYAVEGHNVTDYQRDSLIPRLCASLWGEKGAGYEFFFADTIAPRYFSDPEHVTNRAFDAEAQDDPYVFMEAQLASLRENLPELDPLIAEVEAGNYSALSGGPLYESGIFPAAYLIAFGNLSWVKGEVEWGLEQARRAVVSGNGEEAGALLDALEARIPGLVARQERVKNAFPSAPGFKVYARGDEAKLWQFDPAGHDEVIAELRAKLAADQPVGMPEHVAELIANREVKVARQNFKNPYAADGLRGEGRWHQAAPVEFLTLNGEKLAEYPTRVWLLYDDEALYVLAEMQDSAKPVSEERERDGDVWEDDSFEIFFRLDENQPEPIQISVNSRGDRFDYHPTDGRKKWNPEYDLAVRNAEGFWAAELRIPFSVLGVAAPRAGERWAINICRNRLPKEGTPVYEHGNIIGDDNNWLMANYVSMEFLKAAAPPPPPPRVSINDSARVNKTTEYGYATILTFVPELIFWREAWDVEIVLRVLQGEKVLVEEKIEEKSLPGLWRPSRPVGLDLGQAYDGPLLLELRAAAAGGELNLDQRFEVVENGSVRAIK